MALLTIGLGWREALIVAVAVPVVFGLTLAVNLMLGFTINRVTLFALILSLGLLVDDPIVDVENIARHFALRKKATRRIVLEAVAEIRPPLITATLAVIVSFLPMFFITGMMGPYMRPMALNVPVTMLMSMVVAFTITPWLAYHGLRRKYRAGGAEADDSPRSARLWMPSSNRALYKLFYPLMAPLLRSRLVAWSFLLGMLVLTVGAMGLAAVRSVPLKMLPFDNKNELLLVLDFDEGTTLERSDAAVRDFESVSGRRSRGCRLHQLRRPGIADGLQRPGAALLSQAGRSCGGNTDRSGRQKEPHACRAMRSACECADDLQKIADRHHARMKLVETPPGPPVIASVVAEVYGQPDSRYEDLLLAADTVRARLAVEPGVVDVDDGREAAQQKMTFVTDTEKAALSGISAEQIASTLQAVLGRSDRRLGAERHRAQSAADSIASPARPTDQCRRLGASAESKGTRPTGSAGRTRALGSDPRGSDDLPQEPPAGGLRVRGNRRPAAGRRRRGCAWRTRPTVRTARPVTPSASATVGWPAVAARPVAERTFFSNGSGISWALPPASRVDFAGEGEWKITLDVFRDLGLAFGAAMIAIYILLVAQMGSFVIPLVVMLAIPLTILGVMPGFWLLNVLSAPTMSAAISIRSISRPRG